MPALRLVVLAALSGAIGSANARADGCTLDAGALHSFLDDRSPAIAEVGATRKEERSVEQTVRLRNGTAVTFSVGGCEHFGFRFAFRPLAGVVATMRVRELAQVARAQLAAVPIRADDRGFVDSMVEALSSEEALARAEPFAGGHALVHGETRYEIEVREPGVLEVRSDFPL